MEKLSERSLIEDAVVPQDIGTADITSTYRPVKGYSMGRFVLTGTLADTKIATLQMKQAKDAAGTSAKVLGSAVTQTASGSTKMNVQAEFNEDDLDSNNGFTHVAVTVGTDVNGTVGSCVLQLLGEQWPVSKA